MFENSKWVYQLRLKVFEENLEFRKVLMRHSGMTDKQIEKHIKAERKALIKKIKSLPDSDAEPYGA